jgi:hypothetical protein
LCPFGNSHPIRPADRILIAKRPMEDKKTKRVLTQTFFRMDQEINTIISQAKADAPKLQNRGAYEAFKASFMGPNGSFTQIRKQIASVPKADKPAFGKKINELKVALESLSLPRLKSNWRRRSWLPKSGRQSIPHCPLPMLLSGPATR